MGWSTSAKNSGKSVCTPIVDWSMRLGTDAASWEKEFCTVVDDWEIRAAISLFWDFVSTRKCCKDWNTNTEIIEALKGEGDRNSHEKVESEAIGKPGVRISSIS